MKTIVRRPVVSRDVPILLVVTVLFFPFSPSGTVGTVESMILVATLAVDLYYLSRHSDERADVSSRDSTKRETEGVSTRYEGALFLLYYFIYCLLLYLRSV